MKQLLIFLFLFLSLTLSAKELKLDEKCQVLSIEVKLEKIEDLGENVIISGKIKQRKNFSYSVSFKDCKIETSEGKTIPGKLIKWNDNEKIKSYDKTVSDDDSEKFVISFPSFNLGIIPDCTLTIGNVLDRKNTPIIFQNIKLKKK